MFTTMQRGRLRRNKLRKIGRCHLTHFKVMLYHLFYKSWMELLHPDKKTVFKHRLKSTCNSFKTLMRMNMYNLHKCAIPMKNLEDRSTQRCRPHKITRWPFKTTTTLLLFLSKIFARSWTRSKNATEITLTSSRLKWKSFQV